MQPDIQLIITIIFICGLLWLYRRLKIKRLFFAKSDYNGRVEVFEKYNKELVLTTDSFPQGISIQDKSIKKSYWYKIAQVVLDYIQNKKNPTVLFLGMGALTTPRLISLKNSQVKQTLVEIDPVIVQVCQQFFQLEKIPHLTVIQGDAFKVFPTLKEKYDSIIVDIYQGNTTQVSTHSIDPTFVEKLLPLLDSNGMLLFNRPAHNFAVTQQNQELAEFLQRHFETTEILFVKDPRRYKNHLVIGKIKKS